MEKQGTAMRCKWLVVTLLLMSAPVFAAPRLSHQTLLNNCQAQRNGARLLWQHDLYAVPANIPPLMLAAMDGKTRQVLNALATLPPQQASRWRQLAFFTAVWAGRSATVDALLDDGAAVDASALMPPLKAAFYKQTMGQLAHDWQLDSKAIQKLKSNDFVGDNTPQPTGTALAGTVACDDFATAKVLLQHHADPMQRELPTDNSPENPFLGAIALGEADLAQAFLDYGADPCIENRRLAENDRTHHLPTHTVAGIGQKDGLPPALVQRLICHAPTVSR